MTADVCSSCQTSIYETFGAGSEDVASVDAGTAARWALIPGGGHFKVGQSATGLAVAGLIVATLVFGFAMLGGTRRAVGLVLIVFGLVIWGISAYDATRFAAGNEEAVLLRPRVITSAMGLVFMLVIVAAVSITGGSSP